MANQLKEEAVNVSSLHHF